MGKIWTIATREYRAMVATKAFMISVTVMPILMFGSIFAMNYLRRFDVVEDRTIKVIDQSGKMFPLLVEAAKARNLAAEQLQQDAASAGEGDGDNGVKKGEEDDLKKLRQSMQDRKLSKIKLELIKEAPTPEVRLRLSDEIRDGKIYAFVEIPKDVFEVPVKINDVMHQKQADAIKTAIRKTASKAPVNFYAKNPSFSDERNWLEASINGLVRTQRLQEAGINHVLVELASAKAPFKGMNLVTKSATGEIKDGEEVSRLTAIFLPFGMMMLMFMVIFLAAQPMLESVIEEKSERIAEVLLGCANPFQLMTGKLIGNVGGSLSILGIYMIGGVGILYSKGWMDRIPFDVLPWFLLYQVLSVLLFSSVFMAVGAAVTQTKEAQALLLPVWMVMMVPMFVWLNVIREPDGALATGISYFPPATPLMMILRMGAGARIPVWQFASTSILLVVSTALCLFLAGRIFRIGLLWQGKLPKIHELIRWAIKG